MKSLTIEEVNKLTIEHIEQVKNLINSIISELSTRIITHDISKTQKPEVEIFAEFTPKLADSTYGSEEYKQFLKDMGPALDHHYKSNRHHPEHFKNGINGMNLVDLVEMLCDWKAATLRHNDGDLHKSIEHNKHRFGISTQLEQIFKNTVELFNQPSKR